MLGVDPKLVIANDQVALVRQKRAEAQAAQQQLQATEQASNAARNFGAAAQAAGPGAGGDGSVMNMFSGYQ